MTKTAYERKHIMGVGGVAYGFRGLVHGAQWKEDRHGTKADAESVHPGPQTGGRKRAPLPQGHTSSCRTTPSHPSLVARQPGTEHWNIGAPGFHSHADHTPPPGLQASGASYVWSPESTRNTLVSFKHGTSWMCDIRP